MQSDLKNGWLEEYRLTRKLKVGLSLRHAIVLGIALGILLPALLIGPFLASQNIEREIDGRLRGSLKQYASMLEQSMATPVWHVDKQAAQIFVDSIMLNPEVVSIVVEDGSFGTFVSAHRPELKNSSFLTDTRTLKKDGASIGRITIEVSSLLVEQEYKKNFWRASAAIILQLLISFFLLWQLFQRRMMEPLRQLQRDVDRLGNGQFEEPVQVVRPDEIGDLAFGIDCMRAKLSELMKVQAVHHATLEQRVENRTLALHTSNEELKLALETLKNAQKEIQRSERLAALGALVAGVAHELNTPIGNAVTVASTLHEMSQDFNDKMSGGLTRNNLKLFVDNTRQGNDLLLRNLNLASELIGSFKSVAVDRTSAQRRAFQLDDVVKETILTLGTTIKRSAYDVRAQVAAGIVMESYPGPLGQVLTNLINNAIVHGFDGRNHGEIIISAHRIEGSSPEQVQISVSDNGLGIPDANLGRIFDPFFTTKLGQGGSGLGLNIVYNLIKDVLGGEVVVNSEENVGSVFILNLPLLAPTVNEANEEILPTEMT